jgi:hypothetical protein
MKGAPRLSSHYATNSLKWEENGTRKKTWGGPEVVERDKDIVRECVDDASFVGSRRFRKQVQRSLISSFPYAPLNPTIFKNGEPALLVIVNLPGTQIRWTRFPLFAKNME